MDLLTIFLLFLAGFLSGAVNGVAGGGTFIAFGAMTLAGLSPIAANATSSIAQFPGYVTSTLAYWKDISQIWRQALALTVVSAVGASIGSLILLSLSNPAFRAMVPWLLVGATALFAAGPWLKVKPQDKKPSAAGGILGFVIQFVTSIYGGFFGAGMGIMMLATLGLTEGGDYHRLNAFKNLLSIIVAAVAVAIFATGGVLSWAHAAAMAPGVALGGYAGVWLAKRLPQPIVRGFVIAVGLLLAVYYATGG